MMMWICLGIVAYVVIACVTFIATAEEASSLSALLTAIVWPVLVVFAALFAVFSAVTLMVGYAVFIIRQTFKKRSRA